MMTQLQVDNHTGKAYLQQPLKDQPPSRGFHLQHSEARQNEQSCEKIYIHTSLHVG